MYVSVDIGATNTRVLFSDNEANRIEKFSTSKDYSEEVSVIASMIKEEKSVLEGVSVAVASSVIDGVVNPPNLPWGVQNLEKDLEEALQKDIRLLNDAEAAAIGEGLNGAGRDFEKFLYLTWGTGIGGAIVEKDKDDLTATNIEPGQSTIINGQKLEDVAGGKTFNCQNEEVDIEEINKATRFLVQGIHELLKKYPSDTVIIGGGVTDKNPDIIKFLSDDYQKKYKVKVTFLKGILGDEAALIWKK